MNPTPLRQAALRSSRPLSFKASSSSSASSSTSTYYYPPKKSNGRTLNASTLRSLISLHHESSGFLHDASKKENLNVGFENTFKFTRYDPTFRTYNEFSSNVLKNNNLKPKGGLLENLIERDSSSSNSSSLNSSLSYKKGFKPNSKTFKKHSIPLWSQSGGSSNSNDYTDDSSLLTEREIALKEALYGTYERSSSSNSHSYNIQTTVEPSLDGLLEFVEAKGKSIEEYSKEWENRDEQATESKSTEDGQ
ncbi:uncharacterized protein L201_004754 [Kwoniella dendrophila CBS 6074]|uniref:37S ribosomal protein S25, mitochondrial n=1 Tax=Kwoniella dendrophila CBS 6074 TaxID=1295534 RepID=A0AAX4JX50_9TREE